MTWDFLSRGSIRGQQRGQKVGKNGRSHRQIATTASTTAIAKIYAGEQLLIVQEWQAFYCELRCKRRGFQIEFGLRVGLILRSAIGDAEATGYVVNQLLLLSLKQ